MLKKINFSSTGKLLLFLFIILPFLFQGNTQTFGQTVSGCTSSGPYNTITGELCNTGTASGCLPGYLFSSTTGKLCPVVTSTTPPSTPSVGSLATLNYVKDLLRIRSTYQYPQFIYGATVANNKFIFRGKGCLQNMANTGTGGGVWIASEDGSTITERDTCMDAGAPQRNRGASFHGQTTSGNIFLNWSGDGFVKENISAGPEEANHAVYYSKAGIPRSSSPLHLYNNDLIVLKNRILAPNSRRDYSSRDLISLPDWKLIGTAAVPSGFEGRSFSGFGFGDFMVYPVDGSLFSVSKTGEIKKIKNLPSAEHIYRIGNSLSYGFDYSTTPAKLAVMEVNRSYVVGQQFANNRKISVYKLSLGGVTLDKVINLPDDDAFPSVRGDYALNSFGIWGDYVVVGAQDRSYKFHELQLWKGGQKIHTLTINNEAAPDHILISKNGYVATSMWSSTFKVLGELNDDGQPKTEGGTAAILYKIKVPTSNTIPIPGPGGIPVDVNCDNASGSLADLCKQYKEILRKTCLVAPNIAICQNQ